MVEPCWNPQNPWAKPPIKPTGATLRVNPHAADSHAIMPAQCPRACFNPCHLKLVDQLPLLKQVQSWFRSPFFGSCLVPAPLTCWEDWPARLLWKQPSPDEIQWRMKKALCHWFFLRLSTNTNKTEVSLERKKNTHKKLMILQVVPSCELV